MRGIGERVEQGRGGSRKEEASYKERVSAIDTLNRKDSVDGHVVRDPNIRGFCERKWFPWESKFLCGFTNGLTTGQGSVPTPGMSSSCCMPLAIGKLLVFIHPVSSQDSSQPPGMDQSKGEHLKESKAAPCGLWQRSHRPHVPSWDMV